MVSGAQVAQRFYRAFIVGALVVASGAAVQAQRGPIQIDVPTAGDYLVWALGTTEDGQVALPPMSFTGASASYDLGTTPPSQLKEWAIHVLDRRTGLVAAKTLPAKEGAPVKPNPPIKF
jgi:hypothetical protein